MVSMDEFEMEKCCKALDKDAISLSRVSFVPEARVSGTHAAVLKPVKRVMKFPFVAVSLIVLPLAAHAYDIGAYCRQVTAAAVGDAQLESACREQEQTARSAISRMSVPARVLDYCREVGQSAGGSYRFMQECLEEEAQARDDLK